MEYLTLYNGVKMPVINYGVYTIPAEKTTEAVLNAIEAGYDGIDTAQAYFNEEAVGEAIATCGVPREKLFITTKIWIGNYGYDNCLMAVEKSMKRLQCDYLDLVLLHQPFSDYYGAYRALEDLYRDGTLRAIGVSNFSTERLTDLCLFDRYVHPHVVQNEFSPLCQRYDDSEYIANDLNIQPMAYAPFGQGRTGLFDNYSLVEIGKKYNKSPAQIILRWLYERGIAAACRSTDPGRMRANLEIFDFALDEEDIKAIKTLDTGKPLFYEFSDPGYPKIFEKLYQQRKGL